MNNNAQNERYNCGNEKSWNMFLPSILQGLTVSDILIDFRLEWSQSVENNNFKNIWLFSCWYVKVFLPNKFWGLIFVWFYGCKFTITDKQTPFITSKLEKNWFHFDLWAFFACHFLCRRSWSKDKVKMI